MIIWSLRLRTILLNIYIYIYCGENYGYESINDTYKQAEEKTLEFNDVKAL